VIAVIASNAIIAAPNINQTTKIT